MKNTTIYLLLISILTIVSCTKEDAIQPNLSSQNKIYDIEGSDSKYHSTNKMGGISATDLINKSISNWNKNFGYSVTATGFSHIGNITNQTNRDNIVSAITGDASWAPYGDIMNPKTVSAKQLKYFTYKDSKHFNLVDSLIKVNHELYTIQWQKGKITFSSLAVFDGDELVYDNMISNVILPAKAAVPNNTTPSSPGYECFDPSQASWAKAYWLWGSTRGEARIDVTLDCECETGDCEVFNTTENNKAWFHLGSAEATVKWLDSPNKARCVKYAGVLILKGPMATVSYKFDAKIGEFAVKVEGIGCHYTKTFTNTLCCETTGCQI